MNPAFLALALPLAAAVAAQAEPTEPDQHKIRMDALSRATLDRWDELEYHLGRAGVKTLSFTVDVVAKNAPGITAKGAYQFNGKKSTLKWSPPTAARMMTERGWSLSSFDRWSTPDSFRKSLTGTELSGRRTDGGIVIAVKGETPSAYRSFEFGADGVLNRILVAEPNPKGENRTVAIRLRHKLVGRKYVRTGWSARVPSESGKTVATSEATLKHVGRFLVFDRVVETVTVDGRSFGPDTLSFAEYKINGALVEPKSPASPVGPKPVAPPTSRPTETEGVKREAEATETTETEEKKRRR